MARDRYPDGGTPASNEPEVTHSEAGTATGRRSTDGPRTTSGLLVVFLSAIVGLLGLLGALFGLFLFSVADPGLLRETMTDQPAETEGPLTDGEAIDLIASALSGLGIGLTLGGLLLLVAAVWFVLYQETASRQRGVDGLGVVTTRTAAVLGAFVAIIMVPVSLPTGYLLLPAAPLLGGGLAGYLRRGTHADGAKIGGAAGVLASVPFLVMNAGTVYGVAGLGRTTDAFGGTVGQIGFLLVFYLVVVAVAAVLSAVGGLAGTYLANW